MIKAAGATRNPLTIPEANIRGDARNIQIIARVEIYGGIYEMLTCSPYNGTYPNMMSSQSP